MLTDNSVMVTVAGEQWGHPPARDHPRDSVTTETYHVPVCSADEDDTYGLDSYEDGHHIGHCFTADMPK
eukprot:5172200-Pyramimonas_sp.AAC.2